MINKVGPLLKIQEHQNVAIEDILFGEFGLLASDRAQLHSPCGSGKTYTSFLVVDYLSHLSKSNEDIDDFIAIMICPTIPLLSQVSTFFISQFSGYEIYILCSEENLIRTVEPDVLKSIHGGDVCDFLTIRNKNKIIFTTYISSVIVGDAMLKAGLTANIIIYDEAHRTAVSSLQKNHPAHTMCLFDQYLPAKKRLFATATPKNVSFEGSPDQSYSMDLPSLYGKPAHILSMRKAIDMGIISDYEIAVGLIQTDQQIASETVSVWSAFISCCRSNKASKVIAFHGTIKESKAFAEWAQKNCQDYRIIHADGTNKKTRNIAISALDSNEKIIISNAKLFSEGIDSPKIDIVGFLSYIESEISIIQRVGRAQRKHPDDPNRKGIIFLPIIVSKSGDIKAGKKKLLNIIVALKIHDTKMTPHHVHYSGYSPSGVTFPAPISETEELDDLMQSITSIIIRKDLIDDDYEWKYMVYRLLNFMAFNLRWPTIAQSNTKTEKELARWVNAQLKKASNETLSGDKIKSLLDVFGEYFFHKKKHSMVIKFILVQCASAWFENNMNSLYYFYYNEDDHKRILTAYSQLAYRVLRGMVWGEEREYTERITSGIKSFDSIKEDIALNITSFNDLKWRKYLKEFHTCCMMYRGFPSNKIGSQLTVVSWAYAQRVEHDSGTLDLWKEIEIRKVIGDGFFDEVPTYTPKSTDEASMGLMLYAESIQEQKKQGNKKDIRFLAVSSPLLHS